MMYMIFQQYTTAIQEAYKDRPDILDQAEAATGCREWLESLEISPQLKNGLVEPIRVLEDAFRGMLAE